MTTITLRDNDERFGTVDDKNNLIYPGIDVFGNPIPVRSAVQVDAPDPAHPLIVYGGDGPVTTVVLEKDPSEGFSTEKALFPLEELDTSIADAAAGSEASLSDMTKAQLLDLATERGLTLGDRMTKQAIIDALMKA